MFQRFGCHFQRCGFHGFGKNRQTDAFADDLKLFDGGGTLQIAGGEQRAAALGFEIIPQFTDGGGFPCPLKTAEHDDRRRFGGDLNFAFRRSQQGDEFIVDDLYDLLTRGETFQHLYAESALLHGGDELFHHFEVDIGFQKSQADLTHGFVDIAFRQLSFVSQFIKGIL